MGWFGSLNWRPRFTKLVSAHINDSSVAVLVLLNYWHESDLEVSSSVLLEVCMAVPVDGECSYGNGLLRHRTSEKEDRAFVRGPVRVEGRVGRDDQFGRGEI